MSSIKERLKEVAKYHNLSIRTFEEKCTLGRGNISNMSPNGSIGSDKLSKILDTFPIVSASWLLTGDGDMLSTEKQIYTSSSNLGIPLIPISAMAGALTGDTTILEYECERYIIPAFEGADFLISIKGDSMNPTYQSGDLVACKRTPMSNIFFQWNKTYILDTAQGALVKRIMPGKTEEYITIVSDNPQYLPFQLHLSEVYNVALVIGLLRLE